MHLLRFLFLFLIVIFTPCVGEVVPSPACSKILNYVDKNLPHKGLLKNSNGFIYVDVDDAYVHKLLPFILEAGFQKPPYFGDPDLVGAHITVIYSEETAKYGVKEIKECGEIISFVPKGCRIVQPNAWKEIEEVYFIVVESPQLDKIREKYGLPKREYDFHITIGVKPFEAKNSKLIEYTQQLCK